jgi:hypothetical protein
MRSAKDDRSERTELVLSELSLPVIIKGEREMANCLHTALANKR